MPYSDLKNGVLRSVVDRQRDIDGWNFNISHNTGSADVKERIVCLFFLLRKCKCSLLVRQHLVIALCVLQNLLVFLCFEIPHILRVVCNSLRGV